MPEATPQSASRAFELQAGCASSVGDVVLAKAFLKCVVVGDLAECDTVLRSCPAGHAKELTNLVNEDDASVLMIAIQKEYPNIVRLLLQFGADAAFTAGGMSALQAAVTTKRPFVVRTVTEAYLQQEFIQKAMFLSMGELSKLFPQRNQRLEARSVLYHIYADSA
jgi:hypothetical protein